MDTIRNRVGEVYEPFKVRFLEREIHALADDEVLVRVRASAICGSDLHIARGLHPSAPLPVTIGHEFSGDVTAVGSGVDNVRVGQRVTVEPCIVCGKCDAYAKEWAPVADALWKESQQKKADEKDAGKTFKSAAD